jgi:hypothetical protein
VETLLSKPCSGDVPSASLLGNSRATAVATTESKTQYAWSDGNRLDTTGFPPLPLNREGHGMQSRVIVTGEPLLFNDIAEVVQQPGTTYYDVDREGRFRRLPESPAAVPR